MKSRFPDGLDLHDETAAGTTLQLTGPWQSSLADTLAAPDIVGLKLNYAWGFEEADLGFIQPWGIEELALLAPWIKDVSPIERLGDSLRDLSLGSQKGPAIDLVKLPRLETLSAHWSQVGASIGRATGLRRLTIYGYSGEDFGLLAHLTGLQELELVEARSLGSFGGVAEMAGLQRISVVRGRLLSTLDGLDTRCGTLLDLELELCKKVGNLDGIRRCVNLRRLGVNECGEVESLTPLQALTQLEEFFAWGSTRIADGDLAPLAQLPKLSRLRMRSRSEYTPALEDLNIEK